MQRERREKRVENLSQGNGLLLLFWMLSRTMPMERGGADATAAPRRPAPRLLLHAVARQEPAVELQNSKWKLLPQNTTDQDEI